MRLSITRSQPMLWHYNRIIKSIFWDLTHVPPSHREFTSSCGNVALLCTKQCGHKHHHCLQNTDRWATVIDLPSITGTLIYLLLQPRQGKYRQRGVAWPTGQGCAAQQHSDAHSWITASKIGVVQVWKKKRKKAWGFHKTACCKWACMHRENIW